jgi:hypothetical protein
MNDCIDPFEVFRDIVRGHVVDRNGLELISVGFKYLPDKSDFGTTCCPRGKLSESIHDIYIGKNERTLGRGSLFLKVDEWCGSQGTH